MLKFLFILSALLALTLTQSACPSTLLNKCETDVQRAFQMCDKAAKQKGADQQADIQCMKYLLTTKVDCWPCICQIAKNQGYVIKGCDKLVQFIEMMNQLRKEFKN